MVKNPSANAKTQEMQFRSLGQEDPLKKEMATHSSILAWEIPWTEETCDFRAHEVTKESDTTNQPSISLKERRLSDGSLPSYLFFP